MKSKSFSVLVLMSAVLGLSIAGGCRVKPATSPMTTTTSAPTSTPVVQPTHTPVPVVPTATATPVVIGTITTQTQLTSLIATSTIPVIVDCTASWCVWCTWMEPYLQQFAQDNAGHCLVVKVDCSSGTPAFITSYYPVAAYPTTLFFNHGHLATEIVGAADETGLNTTLAGI